MAQTQNKYYVEYVNGTPYYGTGPQVPYDGQELSIQDFITGANQQIQKYGQYGDAWSQNYVNTLKQGVTSAQSNAGSGQFTGPVTTTNSSGLYSSQEAADYAAAHTQNGVETSTLPPPTTSGGSGGTPFGTSGGGNSSAGGVGGPITSSTTGGYYKVAVPVTKDNPGGFDVYNSQGAKLSLDQTRTLGPNGGPLNLQNLPVGPGSGGSSGGGGPGGGTGDGSGGLTYDASWSTYGVTPQQWSQMSPTQQAMVSVIMTNAKDQYAANASKVTVSDALAAAAKDPSIVSKYADMANIDQASFSQNLAQLQIATATTAQQQKQQFEADRKALAEQQAAAGTAYSGFRGQAQQNLSDTESGIVTSSRAQTQASLDQARQAFEAKYGSAATPSAQLSFANPFATATTSISGLLGGGAPSETLSGNNVGNISGSVPIQKQQDITALASQYVNLGQIIPTTTA